MKIPEKFATLMRDATRLLRGGDPLAATREIQRSLGMHDHVADSPSTETAAAKEPAEAAPEMHDINPPPSPVRMPQIDFIPELLAGLKLRSPFEQIDLPLDSPRPVAEEAPPAGEGEFVPASFTNRAGTRTYKLYIPRGYQQGKPLPLVVMLHGCSQNPDDFAAGTGMNALADERQFLVAYPAQASSANGSRCWNWFQSVDQKRGQGEPSIIAGITREIIKDYSVDPRQVYVAGLSAGGSMAVILGSVYPDLYAAVGVHSGLPYAAAKDLSSAFAAMHGHHNAAVKPERRSRVRPQPVPVIVFHGDRDTTVHPLNGDVIVDQSVRAPAHAKAEASVEEGRVPGGHAYTRTTHHDASGQPIAEKWLVHGAGHAWSGGSNDGSYTDSRGPDASQEMLRFFYTHQQPERAAS
jgi:poly(hydroxyalkanoate) depolymerase family esterase